MLDRAALEQYFPIGAQCTTISCNGGEIVGYKGNGVLIKTNYGSTYVAWYKAVWRVKHPDKETFFVHGANRMSVYDRKTKPHLFSLIRAGYDENRKPPPIGVKK
jgi:hypothetical protein